MIRGLFRFAGVLLLAGGFVFVIYDGARSIADQSLRLTRLEQTWSDIHQTSLAALQPLVEDSIGTWAWASIIAPMLRQPTWLVLGVAGILLMLLFRRRRRLIGYSRD